MNQHLATLVYIVGIAGLFYLDRDPDSRPSLALWIPTIWLMIDGSRAVSSWFQSGPTISREVQYTEGSPLDAAIFGILILGALIVLIGRRRRVERFLRANWAILLYFGWALASVAWSDYSFVATKRWFKAMGDVMMILVVVTDKEPTLAVKRFLARAAFVLLPVSVLFIKYYPDLGRSYNTWTWYPEYCGVTTYKNLLGTTCLVCGMGSLWSLVGAWTNRKLRNRKGHLAAHGATVLITVYLLRTANSMTSLSCFCLAGTLIVLTHQRSLGARIKAAHLVTAAVIAIALSGLFVDPQTMLKSIGRDPTLTGRTEIWHAVLSLPTNPLLGHGFESFWMGDRLRQIMILTKGQPLQEAHNGYLEVYLNLGLIGDALLGVVIVTGYQHAIALFRRDPHAGRIRLAFFAAGVIYSLTEAGFRMLDPVWIAFLLAIMAVPPPPVRKKVVPARKLEEAEPEQRIEQRELAGVMRRLSEMS